MEALGPLSGANKQTKNISVVEVLTMRAQRYAKIRTSCNSEGVASGLMVGPQETQEQLRPVLSTPLLQVLVSCGILGAVLCSVLTKR